MIAMAIYDGLNMGFDIKTVSMLVKRPYQVSFSESSGMVPH